MKFDRDAHVRFTLLTGVSKFSKVSLFSGLNNLIDITLDPRILGHLRLHRGRPRQPCSRRSSPASDRDQIRDWYNGYSWLGDEKVYNPFDLLLLFASRRFRSIGLRPGTPIVP